MKSLIAKAYNFLKHNDKPLNFFEPYLGNNREISNDVRLVNHNVYYSVLDASDEEILRLPGYLDVHAHLTAKASALFTRFVAPMLDYDEQVPLNYIPNKGSLHLAARVFNGNIIVLPSVTLKLDGDISVHFWYRSSESGFRLVKSLVKPDGSMDHRFTGFTVLNQDILDVLT